MTLDQGQKSTQSKSMLTTVVDPGHTNIALSSVGSKPHQSFTEYDLSTLITIIG